MASISKRPGLSPCIGISYNAPASVDKGPGISDNAGGGGTGPQLLQTEAGITLTTESGVAIQTET